MVVKELIVEDRTFVMLMEVMFIMEVVFIRYIFISVGFFCVCSMVYVLVLVDVIMIVVVKVMVVVFIVNIVFVAFGFRVRRVDLVGVIIVIAERERYFLSLPIALLSKYLYLAKLGILLTWKLVSSSKLVRVGQYNACVS